MPRRRARTLALVSALLTLAATPHPLGATPPQPPLELRLVLEETPRPGHPIPYAIEVTSLVPAERLRLRIVPRGGVSLARGDTLSTVTEVAPGRAHRFAGAFRIPPGLRRHVYVRAEITTAGGHVWTRGEHFVLLAGPPVVPDVIGRTVSDGRRGSLIEYDGASPGSEE
jgi:hypothetical protein